MTIGAKPPNLRSRLAGHTPKALRKAVRMVEHYFRRLRVWIDVLREIRGVTARDTTLLAVSACCAPVSALARLDSYRPPRILHDLHLETRAGQFHVRARTDDIIHVLRAREPHTWNALESLLRDGDIFVDAGANIGFYTLLASRKVGPTGQVIAFEMIPSTAAILRAHVADNGAGNVVVIEKALSKTDGTSVRARIAPGTFGQASIVSVRPHLGKTEEIALDTVTLDSALLDFGAIRLIKLDLEGAELLALSGASQVLARTHALLLENNSRDSRIFELVENCGFSIEAIGGNDFFAIRAGN